MKTVVCNSCGWTHFAVTCAQAEAEVKEFNEYFFSLSHEQQTELYGGEPSSIENYRCWCGSTDFKPGSTAPDGSTIGPVIYEGE